MCGKQAKMNDGQLKKFNEADWVQIKPALIKYTVKKAARKRWSSIGLPKGTEPADIANQAIEKTLNAILGEDSDLGQRQWNEKINPELLDHLKDVVDSDLSNLVNSEEHKKTNYSSLLDADVAENLLMSEVNSVRQTLSAEAMIIAKEEDEASDREGQQLMKDLLKELEGDDDAGLIVMAFEELAKAGKPVKPQEAAQHLKMDIKDVRNVMKRIARASEKVQINKKAEYENKK